MSYIKKLVMHGFKSFAKKTEIEFIPEINVVIGPNGSGKSNVADALCFALGRISAKSMRAAKASNMIFLGTKTAGPSKEAVVEIIFDNKDKTFSIMEDELSVKRILRKNGTSVYKINGKTQTRQDALSILAQGGIDPNGFNIIMQHEIQNFANSSAEERRKIIEEVAGISIYELRKEKSIRELEKTSAKLKEIEAVLKERSAYFNNLEKEREAAQKKKKFEEDLKKYRASIIYYDLSRKRKESTEIEEDIFKKQKDIEGHRKIILGLNMKIEGFEEKIERLNIEIQKQTGFEQEHLNKEISDLRSDIAVLKVKMESHEKKKKEIIRQKENFEKIKNENEKLISNLQKESPTIALIQKELSRKKDELEKVEGERKKYYMTKTELKNIKERTEEKNKILQNYDNESNFLMKQVNSLNEELYDSKTTADVVDELKHDLAENKVIYDKLNAREREIEKNIGINNFEIKKEKEVTFKIEELDTCPLCKNKITEEHISHINNEIRPKVERLEKQINDESEELQDIKEKRGFLVDDINDMTVELQKRQGDIIKIRGINDKEEQIKILHKKIEDEKKDYEIILKKKDGLESNFEENTTIEERYETLRIEVQDISIRNKENLNSEISYKQKELERATISMNQLVRDEEDLDEEIKVITLSFREKEEALLIKRQNEDTLKQKAEKFTKERSALHQEQRDIDRELSIEKNKVYNLETRINNLKVDKARVDAQIQGFETDILEYPNVDIIKGNKESLIHRARKAEETLARIGTVNMRSLEIYEEVKAEYESITLKVETIGNEKEKILKLIHKIDIEKKKVFLRIFEELNGNFARNFSKISTKGQVYLELQNRKDPFSAGVDVKLKTGHGKHFDIKSLSGGEKTMVALSLIFAIQELKPYTFYILDEIDAALDKRNASRLADFLKKYADRGQYIIVSHNDEIITNASTLYGVSMHDGISKLTSLKV